MRNGIYYDCNDCGRTAQFSSYIKARAAGWAISKDYKKCYCPSCAPNHRNGGAAKAKGIPLYKAKQQLKIKNL